MQNCYLYNFSSNSRKWFSLQFDMQFEIDTFSNNLVAKVEPTFHLPWIHKSSNFEYALIGCIAFCWWTIYQSTNVFPTCCRVKMLIVCQKAGAAWHLPLPERSSLPFINRKHGTVPEPKRFPIIILLATWDWKK